MGALDNLTNADAMKRIREVDFVQQFTHGSLNKLIEVLGVTRKIPMMEGTTLYLYTMSGTLQDGAVDEGDVIPLSKIEQTKTPIGEIKLNKYRKGVSAEAIMKSGSQTAIVETDAKLVSLVQNGIRTDLFGFLNGAIAGAGSVSGNGLQAALAAAWGQLQVRFEDDTAEAVYFLNPLDVADYLASASISVQTAFGMNYVENFLGLGTVILSSRITQGTFVATAKQNIIMYYLNMNGDVAKEFGLTTDELGYIGISSGDQNKERAQIESLVMDGIQFMVEYAAGVVKGNINSGNLSDLTIAAAPTDTDFWGTTASQMQSGVTVSGKAITGTLTKLTSGSLVDVWGEGYFIGLKFSNFSSGLTYADCQVGLAPTEGAGLVTLEDDTLAVFKVTDKNAQKLEVVQAKTGVGRLAAFYDLSGLTLA